MALQQSHTQQHPMLPDTIAALRDSDVVPPPQKRPRTIVVCLDGTGDKFDSDNTNIVKIFAALRKDTPEQLTYYQAGIGTYSNKYVGKVQRFTQSALDMAVGSSLGEHVRDAYRYLMHNYKKGDRICLFGFSRGAHTTRALAGMLYKVGLLPAHNEAQLTFAYSMYKDDSKEGWEMSADFKRTFCIDVEVYFVGCFDTVASVGIFPRVLPFTKANQKAVTFFRHAVALDERRIKFLPSRWSRQNGVRNTGAFTTLHGPAVDAALAKLGSAQGSTANPANVVSPLFKPMFRYVTGKGDGSMWKALRATSVGAWHVSQLVVATLVQAILAPLDYVTSINYGGSRPSLPDILMCVLQTLTLWQAMCVRNIDHWISASYWGRTSQSEFEKRFQEEQVEENRDDDDSAEDTTNVVEVHFAGEHADCGGGTVKNKQYKMASRIPLRWMIRECFACETGILFRTETLAEHGLDVDSLYPQFLSRTPSMQPNTFALANLPTFASADEERKNIRQRIIEQPTLPEQTLPANNSSSSSSSLRSVPSMTTMTPRPSLHRPSSDFVSEANFSPETHVSDLSYASRSTRASSIATSEPGGGRSTNGVVAPSQKQVVTTNVSKAHSSTKPQSEDHEDHYESIMDIHDQLVEKKTWWLLEWVPLRFRVKLPDGELRKVRAPHLGRYRAVSDQKPLLHYSVALRLLQDDVQYQVRCPTNDAVEWQIVV